MDKKNILVLVLVLSLIFLVAAEMDVTDEASDYILSFISKQGIEKENIRNISQVNKTNLPGELTVSNMQENNVGIYEVNYLDEGINKNLFVISYTSEKIEEVLISDEVKNIQYLIFNSNERGFMQEYVMLDSGSITGLSTSTDFLGVGNLKIEVYKNGEALGLINEISSEGDKFDYELQSKSIDTFMPGDIISVYIDSNNLGIGEVNSIVRIEF